MVGQALSETLINKGFDVIILTRDPDATTAASTRLRYAAWNPGKGTLDPEVLLQADAVVHLAGAGVADKRWSRSRKAEILNSRVSSGQLLTEALQRHPHQIKTFITASAIGWYGPDPSHNKERKPGDGFTEEAPAFTDFLGDTCRQWEASTEPLAATLRRVCFRIGIVLSPKGGALKEFMKPLRFGIASILGSGEQVVSWIHIDDLVRMIVFALEEKRISGIYNAVAPAPVSNKTLTLQLARQMRGTFFIPLPVPAFVLKVMLGEMSIEVLKSCTVSSGKIGHDGFIFQFPSVEAALKDLV